jgi:FAD-linked oxidoreductase
MNRRRFLAHGALLGLFAAASSRVAGARPATIPWRNWSGNVIAHPRARFVARDEDDLVRFLRETKGAVRPVGSGHSFSPLVPTHGDLIVIDRIRGLLSRDDANLTATFGAGVTLAETGPLLDAVGQAMFNLPDVDRQTLAGAIATATHGTGLHLPCLSAYVKSLRLITPSGDILDIDADSDRDLLSAARVNLGALGVVTRITMQNRRAYRLKQRTWVERTDDILDRFDELAAAHRHFEIFPLTHSDYSIALCTDETTEPVNNPLSQEQAAFEYLTSLLDIPPAERKPLIDAMAKEIEPEERVDASYRILSTIRVNRFNEMEYSAPLHAGAECLREILRAILERQIDVVAPLEYRYVAPDDAWLSMNSGEEARVAISVHRVGSRDYRPYFELIEPIFWKHGARPHWGKVHSLGAADLHRLYPDFQRFLDVRARLDPRDRMLNAHLANLFGVRSHGTSPVSSALKALP